VDAYLQAGLDALGDGTRMAIFQQLTGGPMAVHELAGNLPVSRPAVSQHLRVLQAAGLVTNIKSGTSRRYQLNPEGIARLRAHFDQVWDKAMSAFEITVNAEQIGPPKPTETGDKHDQNRRSGPRQQKRPRSSSH